MPPMPFLMPPLFITAVKDICAINTFEKLLNILFSEVHCLHFGFTTLLFSETTTDMSLHELSNVFPLSTRISVFSSSPTRRPCCSCVVTPARNALEEQRWREVNGILVAHVL